MIKTEKEYNDCLERLSRDHSLISEQRKQLSTMGLSQEEIDRAMHPLLAFSEQLGDELKWYERVKKRDFDTINDLTSVGRMLIALRIANGVSQKELADRLNVDVSQISRDERNEYHGVSLTRAQKIVEALGERLVTAVAKKEMARI